MDRIKDMASNVNPADIQKYTQGINFPASKDEVASQVQSNGGSSDIVDKIKNAATDKFNSPQDVIGAVTGS